MGESSNMFGRRAIVVDASGVSHAVPIEFTDLVEPSEELRVAAGRAVLLVDDLLKLAGLVARVGR